jgi:isoquinoline 1-oxidoreductase alpha subunit
MAISATVNGKAVRLDGPPDMPLLWALRDLLGMTGTKFGCGIGQCGACTVQLDGKPVRSCMLPIGEIAGDITTIEGIGDTEEGQGRSERDVAQWMFLDVGEQRVE